MKSRSVDKFESLIVIEVLLVPSSVERLYSTLSGRGFRVRHRASEASKE